MQYKLRKKRIILTIAGGIVLVSLVVFFLINTFQVFYTKLTLDRFEEYLLNDFNLADLDESEFGPLYDLYLYTQIEQKIEVIGLEKEGVADFLPYKDLEKYDRSAKEAERLFLIQCSSGPEKCHPLWAILPYCMAQWADGLAQERYADALEFKKEISKNHFLVQALNYWRDYLDAKEWREEDLSAVLGFVLSENLCGDIQNLNIKNWSERVIRVEIEATEPSEKMRYIFERIRIIFNLHDRLENVNKIPSYEGLEDVCLMPAEDIIFAGSACDVIYYYRNKRFCIEDFKVDHGRLRQIFQERPLNPEEVLCQISLREWARIYF